MNINATLFAQVVHFFIAYALLSRFFLRPAVALIFEESTHQEQLQEGIEAGNQLCIHKQDLQKKQWRAFQEKWQKRIPAVSFYAQQKSGPELQAQQPSQERVLHELQSVTIFIKKKADDAL